MKYTFKFLALIAAASIVFFSCEKETASDAETEVPGTTDPSAQEETNPGENTQFDPDAYLLSFGAGFENDAKSKVGIDIGTGALTLEEGDKALVYNGKASAVYVYDGAQFKSENPVTLEAGCQVFYPAEEFGVSDPDGNVIFTMPAAVTDIEDLGAKNPLAGNITVSAGVYSVTFKAVGSILQVGVTGTRTLNSLELSNTALDLGEGAEFTIGWDGEGNPTMATTGKSNLSMSITGLSRDLDATTPAVYYFLLPAVAYEGLTVTAGLATADQGGLNTFAIVRGDLITATRNKVMKMSFYAGLFSGGEGTIGDPYLIKNARDFKHISKYCAEGYGSLLDADHFLGAFYKQTADINFIKADLSKTDLSDYMIGGADTPFKGTYDGTYNSNSSRILSNFTISGTPSSDKEGVAPFKAVDNAVLKHISISGATISGGKFTAGLVGYAKGSGLTIQNCTISSSTISDTGNDFGAAGLIGGIYGGTVTNCSGTNLTISTDVANKAYFGGLISYSNGNVTVSGCELNGTTTVTKAQKFGGIIGQINNVNVRIEDCHNHSTINGSKNYNGGICGYAKLGTIYGCTNDKAVNGLSSTAGIVAQLDGATVDHCTNSGTIHGSENYAAGIVAYHTKGNLTNSVNTGTISADGAYVGGIAGMLKSSANYGLIKGCRSNATLSGANDVAGIVGRVTWGIVMDCFAKGTATGGINTGGIVGYAYSTDGNVAILNCLSSVDVTTDASGNTHSGGVIGRATCVDSKYVYIGNCAGLNNVVKATQSDAIRFGAFTGFTNAEKKSGSATANRVRIWNSYTLVDDTNFQCANTGATADVGGFVGRMGAASDLGDCYYIIDGSKSTLNGSTYKNITQTTAAVIGGTGNIAVNPTRQGLNLNDTFLKVLNRCTYASNGTTRLAAFTDYPMCDWTMTGANSEALSHPVPANLVALGPDFYE